MSDYKSKYLKYKLKYLNLKEIHGGGRSKKSKKTSKIKNKESSKIKNKESIDYKCQKFSTKPPPNIIKPIAQNSLVQNPSECSMNNLLESINNLSILEEEQELPQELRPIAPAPRPILLPESSDIYTHLLYSPELPPTVPTEPLLPESSDIYTHPLYSPELRPTVPTESLLPESLKPPQ